MGEVIPFDRRKKKRGNLPLPPLQRVFIYYETAVPRGVDVEDFLESLTKDVCELVSPLQEGDVISTGFTEEEGEA